MALLLIYGVVAVVLTSPALAQRAVESLRFEERLGTVPVEVGVVHNGYSVVDTGALGSVYLDRTGPMGLGLRLRVTGPPDAGSTLASYLDPRFVRANTAILTAPEQASAVYTSRLVGTFGEEFAQRAVVVGLVGGLVLLRVGHPVLVRARGRRRAVIAGVGASGILLASTGVAAWQHATWPGSDGPDQLYPLAAEPGLSFSSPQVREVAAQVRPFIEKNVTRLRERAEAYEKTAEASIRVGVAASAPALRPRDGERIVIAEGDPQGSEVGTDVREVLYEQLRASLGDDALLARTISGDITSNGTVAEGAFVEDEVAASGELPVLVVKGDHDSVTTVEQLQGTDAEVLDRDVVEVRGVHFTGGADPEFKSLFGGSVTNPSGVTPAERGAELREVVEDEVDGAVHVLLHQNDAALGYLGFESMGDLYALPSPETEPLTPRRGRDPMTRPRDDGIPDVPPGSVTYGHWHANDGPWVIWNTDGDDITWTLVDQVGTSGGVEASPTFNRFSTPYSPPLKPVELRLHYVDTETGLVTGFVSVGLSLEGQLQISRRTDVGVPLSR